MNEAEHLSQVIERIYDAAIDAPLWPQALEGVCRFVQGCTANMFYQDTSNQAAMVFYSWGDDPHYRQLYIDSYAELNPLFPASAFFEVGTIHALKDVIPLDEFRETRLYREWVQPQGILDVLYANIERTATGAAGLAIRRLEVDGLFDADAKARFAMIVPHVRRAVSIGRVLDFHKQGAADLRSALDGLAASVFLVADNGRITFANEPASTMLAKGDIMRAAHNRLTAADPAVNSELHEALAAAGRSDAQLGVKGIAISLAGTAAPSSAPAFVAHVLSLRSGARRATLSGQATAAVFVRPITSPSPSSLELVTRLYRLTPSEVRVLAGVMTLGEDDSLADRLGISNATVKTHLNHLFVKTGTHRRSELVRLAASFSSPFAD